MALFFGSLFNDLLAVAAVLISIVVLYTRHQFSHWQRRGIPFALPRFPFGNLADTFLQRRAFVNVAQDLYRTTGSPPVLGIWTALSPNLLVFEPRLIREVLIKDFANFSDRGLFSDADRDPLSGHLFSLGGEKWRLLRTKLSPTFTSGKMKAMFGTLVECGAPLSAFLATAADNLDVVEMRELMAQYTTNVIASAAFGLQIDCIGDPDNDFRSYGRKVFAPTVWNNFRLLLMSFFPRFFGWTGIKSVDADVERFFMSVVQQNIEHRESNRVERKDFFQLLLQLRNGGGVQEDGVWQTKVTENDEEKLMSVGECAAQSFVFFLAGFETSSSTVSFALYELAKQPECQRRLQRDIDEVLRRHGGEVTYESVSEMRYLEWCFDETLRKYPAVPTLTRVCSEDWHIPGTEMHVSGGTMLLIPIYALQMDPKYYPEPETFLPERFDPEHETFSAQRPYYPFGDGPRNCIGMRFGKMQSKVALVCMLREFWFEVAGNTEQPLVMSAQSFLLSPKGGIQLRVTRRVN